MIQAMLRNKFSWCVILLIAIGLPLTRVLTHTKTFTAATTTPSESIDLPTLISGKYIVGMANAVPSTKPDLARQLDALSKSPMQRIAAATLAGELNGRKAAVERLATLGNDPDATAFTAVYDYGTPLPTDVAHRYGFFAELAASIDERPTDRERAHVIASSKKTLLVLGGLSAALIAGTAIGFALLVTAIVLASLGKLRLLVVPPTRQAASAYVQAFAFYLSLLIVASIGMHYAFERWGKALSMPDAVQYLPLLLAVEVGFTWPIVRGVKFAQLRIDWGLHTGRGVFIEPLAGIAGYLAGLPIVAVGVLITLVLSRWSGADVSHPIVNELFGHPYMIFFLAVVFAPITEESLFRGAFVSHLRSGTNPWIAALVSGLVFAAVHPQGWAAIPVLGSIGFVFAMIRQWRGTLLASMTAHALNNAMAMTLVYLLGS